mmetsp:Transcript_434/g.1290  ORF Transcript_434/g.1290 Transcript_434/m.1290 type:complete len:80 (+) Transcript_434:1572-1811(+)
MPGGAQQAVHGRPPEATLRPPLPLVLSYAEAAQLTTSGGTPHWHWCVPLSVLLPWHTWLFPGQLHHACWVRITIQPLEA